MRRKGKRVWPGILTAMLLALCAPLCAHAEDFDCAQGRHDYEIVTKQPTETEDGQTTYRCRVCGFTFSRALPATGHVWSEWAVELEPTCTREGLRCRVCTRHGNDPHREEEGIPALGHQFIAAETPPTCVKDGVVTETCARCGETRVSVGKKAAGHSYEARVLKEASCEEAGETVYTCALCGDHYSAAIPALGHDWGEWEDVKPATEEETGLRRRTCAHGHGEEEVLPMLAAVTAMPPPTAAPAQPPEENYAVDVALAIAMGGAAAGFGWAIQGDLRVLRWAKRGAKTYAKWLAKPGR